MVLAIDELSDPSASWTTAPASELNLRRAQAVSEGSRELLPLIRLLWTTVPADAAGAQRLRDLAEGCSVSEDNRVLVHNARLTSVLVSYLCSTQLPDAARAHSLQALTNLAMGSSDHSAARRAEMAEGLSPLLAGLIEDGLGTERRMRVTVQMWAIDLSCKLAVSSATSLDSLRRHGIVPALLSVLDENTSRGAAQTDSSHATDATRVAW
jgi:hypothetical protein